MPGTEPEAETGSRNGPLFGPCPSPPSIGLPFDRGTSKNPLAQLPKPGSAGHGKARAASLRAQLVPRRGRGQRKAPGTLLAGRRPPPAPAAVAESQPNRGCSGGAAQESSPTPGARDADTTAFLTGKPNVLREQQQKKPQKNPGSKRSRSSGARNETRDNSSERRKERPPARSRHTLEPK